MSEPTEPTEPPSTVGDALLLEGLRASNQTRMDALAAHGWPMNVLGCWAADLLDYLMPEGTVERLQFDSRWEHHLSVLLDEAEQMTRRAALTLDDGRGKPIPEQLLDRARLRAAGNG